MSCRANDNGVCKWRGNVNGVCKCEEQCDMSDLTYVHHGEWGPCSVADDFSNGIAHHSCELRCNGKVTSCKATCSQGGNSKGNWQYSSEIKKDFCSKLKETGKDPCKNNECIKCNDMTVSFTSSRFSCYFFKLRYPQFQMVNGIAKRSTVTWNVTLVTRSVTENAV